MKQYPILAAIVLVTSQLLATQAFVAKGPLTKTSIPSTSRMFVGPFQKLSNPKEYNKVVDGLMTTKGLTREEAEKEYNDYLNNPNDYALNKGEAYYKSLGYKNLMDGVIGEAEKEGRGDEVRERVEKFNRESKNKGLLTIGFFIAVFFYLKITNPYVPPV